MGMLAEKVDHVIGVDGPNSCGNRDCVLDKTGRRSEEAGRLRVPGGRPRYNGPGVLPLTRFVVQANNAGVELGLEELGRRLSDAQGIKSLVQDGIEEGEYLDFKRQDPYTQATRGRAREKARYDFRKDVTALANHLGGFLVIGIDEDKRGRAREIVQVPDSQAVRIKLNDLLADPTLIRPGIIGPKVSPVDTPLGDVLVVQVPGRPRGVVHRISSLKGDEEVWVRCHRRNRLLGEDEVSLHEKREPPEGFPPGSRLAEWLAAWIPEFLTGIRVPLGIAAAVTTVLGSSEPALLLYMLGLSTDVLDGMSARALKHTTGRGKRLDREMDLTFNAASGLGLVLASAAEEHFVMLSALAAVAAAFLISTLKVKPHSAVAKYRSGAIRLVLLSFFWWRLPAERRLLWGAVVFPLFLLGAGLEYVGTSREVRGLKRGMWREESEQDADRRPD